MCLAHPKKAVRYALVATFASVLGGLLGYAIGHFLYDTLGAQLLSLLGLTEKFPKAACYLRQYGAEIIMVKGLTPIPFILLTITAGFISFPLPTFLGASLISRGAIFLFIGVLFRVFGPPIKMFLDRYLGIIAAACLAVLVSGYVAISLLGGEAKATSEKCDTAAHSVSRQS
jgi:membrane protein YqaA with SNARE-associated domain